MYFLCGHVLFTGVLQEEAEHRLNHRRNVHLQLITHGNHYLLNQQYDGVLDGAGWIPELLHIERYVFYVKSAKFTLTCNWHLHVCVPL